MADILKEQVDFSIFDNLLLLEGRKHDNYSNNEIDLVFSMIAKIETYMYIQKPVKIIQYWYVGITDDIVTRQKKHGNPEFWKAWDCKNDRISRIVEIYFTKFRGTQGAPGGGTTCRYIYCFLAGPKAKVIA